MADLVLLLKSQTQKLQTVKVPSTFWISGKKVLSALNFVINQKIKISKKKRIVKRNAFATLG